MNAATQAIIRLVERRNPDVDRRVYAALAIAAAERGGLPEPKLRELRHHFDLDSEDTAAKGG